MPIVECPHCRTRVTNDGSLSLMVVTCPGCMAQFQMPAYEPAPPVAPAAPPAPAAFGDSSSNLEDDDSFPTRRRRVKRSGPSLWGVAIGSTVVFWVVVFLVLWASGFSFVGESGANKKGGKKKQPEPKLLAPQSEMRLLAETRDTTGCGNRTALASLQAPRHFSSWG
jgi:hypothetical protein